MPYKDDDEFEEHESNPDGGDLMEDEEHEERTHEPQAELWKYKNDFWLLAPAER